MTPEAGRFQNWLRALPGWSASTVVAIEPLDGGASNITCRVRLANAPASDVVLRMQRSRGIFEPYDVIREGETLSRLHPTAVPVPAVLGMEPDPAALGAPFIVLGWIDAPHMGAAPGASFAAFTAAVATIHGLDWRALGFDFLGVPGSPAEALIREMDAVEARRVMFPGADGPLLLRALPLLRETVPQDGQLALCQGDINVFNYLFRAGEVVGVVDWEQAHISDPRSDVGQLLALSLLKGAPVGPADEQPFARAYSAITGTPLRRMAWFRARWLWDLAVIYYGWLAFSGTSPWYTREAVFALLEDALDELA